MISLSRLCAATLHVILRPSRRGGGVRAAWRLARTGAALMLVLITGMAATMGTADATTYATPAAAPSQGDSSLFLPLVKSPDSPQSLTYDVEYADNTLVVDESTLMDDLLFVSEDQAVFHFRSPAHAIQQLRPGQVVLFAGLALRKVARVSTEGATIVLETEPAQLNEAIADGTLAWSYTVDWMAVPQASYRMARVGKAGSELQLVSARGFDSATEPPEITFSGEIDGWQVTLKLKAASNRLNVEVVAERAIGAAEAVVSAKGWISKFTHHTLLTYEQSRPGQISVRSNGLQGEMELKWSAATPGTERLTENAMFAIPIELPIPLRVGPIPVTLKLKAVLELRPELTVAQASSTGSYKVTYRSDQGFQTEGEVVHGSGEIRSVQIGLTGDTGSAGFGPVGFGLGVEFPRLEVDVLGSAVAFISIKTYSSSIYLIRPPCQKATTTLFAAAGYRLGFLGFTFADEQKELWRKEFVKYKDDQKCD